MHLHIKIKSIKIYILFALMFLFITTKAQVQTFLNESFSTCNPFPFGWSQFSQTGSQQWSCTPSGFKGSGIFMSGYANSHANKNKNWLISPSILINNSAILNLQFYAMKAYSGASLTVLVSQNISQPNPTLCIWDTLDIIDYSDEIWHFNKNIRLDSLYGKNFKLAFLYTSDSVDAASWYLDNIKISSTIIDFNTSVIDFNFVSSQNYSEIKSFLIKAEGIQTPGQLSLRTNSAFQISEDSLTFGNTINLLPSQNGFWQKFYVRAFVDDWLKVYNGDIFAINSNDTLFSKPLQVNSLDSSEAFKLLTWNVRWFGDPSACGCDTALAYTNIKNVLATQNPDIVTLQEVVDKNQIRRLAKALNMNVVLSPFGSFANDTTSSNWAGDQKLAFLYKPSRVNLLGSFGLSQSTYPFLSNSNSPYYYFSSGRFPFTAKFRLYSGQNQDTFQISNLHAKANSGANDINSYNRRAGGAQVIADSLNVFSTSMKNIVVGDYNDLIEGTVVTSQSMSCYKYMMNNGFVGLTPPDSFIGKTTYAPIPNSMIDNIIVNNAAFPYMIPGSIQILSFLNSQISSYVQTTSDHYPVVYFVRINKGTNGVSNLIKPNEINAFGFKKIIYIVNNSKENIVNVNFKLLDILGRTILNKSMNIDKEEQKFIQKELTPGLYFMQLENNQIFFKQKIMIQ